MRIFQKPGLKAFIRMAFRRAQNAGQQPHHRFEQDHRGNLAPGEHVIADRDLFEPPAIDHPLVDPLEPSTYDDGTRPISQIPHPLLG